MGSKRRTISKALIALAPLTACFQASSCTSTDVRRISRDVGSILDDLQRIEDRDDNNTDLGDFLADQLGGL